MNLKTLSDVKIADLSKSSGNPQKSTSFKLSKCELQTKQTKKVIFLKLSICVKGFLFFSVFCLFCLFYFFLVLSFIFFINIKEKLNN